MSGPSTLFEAGAQSRLGFSTSRVESTGSTPHRPVLTRPTGKSGGTSGARPARRIGSPGLPWRRFSTGVRSSLASRRAPARSRTGSLAERARRAGSASPGAPGSP